jgi:hypothetical protein
MSDLRDAAELALTALETTCPNTWTSVKENLRKALAQSEKETLTLDRGCWERGCMAYDNRDGDGVTVSIREWVGLTDEEVCEMDAYTMAITDQETIWLYRFARAIEAKLKEKNA